MSLNGRLDRIERRLWPIAEARYCRCPFGPADHELICRELAEGRMIDEPCDRCGLRRERMFVEFVDESERGIRI